MALNKEQLKQLVPIVIACALGFAWAAYQNPYSLFGLSASSDCKDYNTSEVKYRVQFPDRCGCLYPEQADALANAQVRAAALACFETEMKQCRGWEKIGDAYRSCVAKVTGVAGK